MARARCCSSVCWSVVTGEPRILTGGSTATASVELVDRDLRTRAVVAQRVRVEREVERERHGLRAGLLRARRVDDVPRPLEGLVVGDRPRDLAGLCERAAVLRGPGDHPAVTAGAVAVD